MGTRRNYRESNPGTLEFKDVTLATTALSRVETTSFNETQAETTLDMYKVLKSVCYVVVVPTRSQLCYITLQRHLL